MKAMFVAKPQGELTQVDFWNLYKDVFTPFQDRLPLLVASDVIKNVTVVFPQAQAMVLPGPPQRFVVRGVDRRKETVADERFRCQWDRAQCSASPFKSAEELYEHLQEHIRESEGSELACLWMSCQNLPLAKHFLRAHVLTHLSSSQPKPKPPSQSDTINLPSDSYPHPTSTPTHRPPPLPAKTTITYKQPVLDPPSTALTALLCIRILFRASFASTEAAPRADADHFGFPLSVEEADDQDMDGEAGADDSDVEAEGERRGRKAFLCVRSLMESIQLRDEVLMAWIAEMVEAGLTGRND
jgi:chromatin structure-remodeling complex subunit RSC9